MSDYSRRRFLQYGLGAGAAIGFPVTAGRVMEAGRAVDADRAHVAGHTLRRFVERLPVPGAGIVVASPRAPGKYAFTLRQIRRRLHPQLPPTPF
jgi:hypothetical protein